VSPNEKTFRLARMSPQIVVFTNVLLALPILFLAIAAFGNSVLLLPALLILALDLWVWLRMRPMMFVVDPNGIDVAWPLKRRRIDRADIAGVRLIDVATLRRELGFCMRVGVGGLYGAFGWLWSRRRGIVQMYVSRTDGLVWIERVSGRPWMITPEHPEAFVRALSSEGG